MRVSSHSFRESGFVGRPGSDQLVQTENGLCSVYLLARSIMWRRVDTCWNSTFGISRMNGKGVKRRAEIPHGSSTTSDNNIVHTNNKQLTSNPLLAVPLSAIAETPRCANNKYNCDYKYIYIYIYMYTYIYIYTYMYMHTYIYIIKRKQSNRFVQAALSFCRQHHLRAANTLQQAALHFAASLIKNQTKAQTQRNITYTEVSN